MGESPISCRRFEPCVNTIYHDICYGTGLGNKMYEVCYILIIKIHCGMIRNIIYCVLLSCVIPFVPHVAGLSMSHQSSKILARHESTQKRRGDESNGV